ncbi:hypothetical protein [Streptomyces lonarensis]|uniref:Lipoprotein n=1 Tax=Streptomyces lonarensis TaxID=700599 RepID=A0A7X6HX37_9ACTN|nr:hypothetical protein [Streptomyces lonarensis]NJQ04123.1 hypothetical protein [Streptomyces lonarensis]
MKRHLALSVVVAAMAGLLLSSCSAEEREPAGDAADMSSPSPSPSPSEEGEPGTLEGDGEDASGPADGDVARPEIDVPDDLEKVFEPVDTDDPDQLAVLADQEQYIWAVDEAITSGSVDRPALAFYSDGEGYLTALDYISSFHDDGYTVSGTVRYYDRRVTLRGDGAATSSYCVDWRNSSMVDLESGERFPEGERQGLYTSRLERNEAEVWQTVDYSLEDGAGKCA